MYLKILFWRKHIVILVIINIRWQKKKKLVTDNIGLRHSVQKYLTVKMKK